MAIIQVKAVDPQLTILDYYLMTFIMFNNFLTSILFLFGINSIISSYGSVNFIELNFFFIVDIN